MAKKDSNQNGSVQNCPAPTTPEAQENLMISLAMERAKQQLMDGTASSQVITHFLRLASMREKNEAELNLLKAKQKAINEAADSKAVYEAAIRAMRVYQGVSDEEEDDEEYGGY